MTVTTNEFGQQNLFAKEPQMVVESYNRKGLESPQQYAETYNGRWAMMGIISGFISYAATGKFFFGIFWWLRHFSLWLALHFLYCLVTLYNNLLKLIDGKLPSWNSHLLCYWWCPSDWCPRSILFCCIHVRSSKYERAYGWIQGSQNLRWLFNLWEHP